MRSDAGAASYTDDIHCFHHTSSPASAVCPKQLQQAETVTAWVRVGSCAQLPLVLVGGLSYEHTSDTVTAATMGRGVYILPNASVAILAALRA